MPENKTLLELREEIDRIDQKLLPLLEARLDVAQKVGEYKKEHGLSIYNGEREQQVIKSRRETVSNPEYADYAEDFFETVMSLSRRLQGRITAAANLKMGQERGPAKHPRLCYPGVRGSYSEEALGRFFGNTEHAVSTETFAGVADMLLRGQADYGILPVENSSTGAIDDVLDLLAEKKLSIVGEEKLKVEHCLLGVPGSEISDIREIYSQQQGFYQSGAFLETLPGVRQIPLCNTAVAAKYVAEQKDKSMAAIASKRTAALYGLKVLAQGINAQSRNTTRFIIVSAAQEIWPDANQVSLMLTLPHRSGTLCHVLRCFADQGLNLLHIESRPLPGRNFEYRFYIDFEGALRDETVRRALEELAGFCLELHVLGNYRGSRPVG